MLGVSMDTDVMDGGGDVEGTARKGSMLDSVCLFFSIDGL